MPRFIETDRGWLNLDHVRELIPESGKKQFARGRLYAANSEHLGNTLDYLPVDPNTAGAVFVPAAAGVCVTVVMPERPEGGGRPVEVWVRRYPVAAWKLEYGAAEPVLCEAASEADTVLIECPEGRYLIPEDAEFDDLNEAKRFVLERAQARWDSSKAKADTA